MILISHLKIATRLIALSMLAIFTANLAAGNSVRAVPLATPELLETPTVPANLLPSGASSVKIVLVRAKQGWRDTGVQLKLDQLVSVEYVSGQWTRWLGRVALSGGLPGEIYLCNRADCGEPIPAYPSGALIGRVHLQLLEIGNGLAFTVKSAGQLQLRINDADSGLSDNEGEILVRITAWEPTRAALSRTIQVAADQRWQDNDITLSAGDQVIVEYLSGEWTRTDGVIPSGDGRSAEFYVCGRPDCTEPMPYYPAGALIGRVGDQKIGIGNGVTFTAQSAGKLELRMNDADDALWDNAGTISVHVIVWHTGASS